MKFHVGGEPFYSPALLFKKREFQLSDYTAKRFNDKLFVFTGGGVHSLYLILNNINFKKSDYCILPSYLCPTILYPFKKLGIKFKFYRVNAKLEIDNGHLKEMVTDNCKSIFFINYFGFPHRSETLNVLKQFKQKGIIIIEDASQSFFSNFKDIIGNYYFNSFRKFLPLDGSVIISDDNINLYSFNSYRKYLTLKIAAQFLRYLNYQTGIDLSQLFKSLFKSSEGFYYDRYPAYLHKYNQHLIEKFNFEELILKRREYFNHLITNFSKFSFVKELPDNVVPLGYPIICRDRDAVRKNLINENVFCPVHWHLPDEVFVDEFNESTDLSKMILTLPVSESITQSHFNTYVSILKKHLN